MNDEEVMRLWLEAILDGGSRDIQFFINKVKTFEKIGFDIDFDEMKDLIEDIEDNTANINSWIEALMRVVIDQITAKLNDRGYEDVAEKLNDEFSPYLNFLDSWFNIECLDEAEDTKMEDLIKCIIKEVRK